MPIAIRIKARDQSSLTIGAWFYDDRKNPTTHLPDPVNIAPTTMAWTLMDVAGNIINSRSAVNISSPAADQDIVLSGDDLKSSP